jgi:superfamily I DNA and/or RNA helicase
MDEVTTVNQLIRHYYEDTDVCVITPYDTQRSAISNDLKSSGLEAWERVYNVDSFQGMRLLLIVLLSS